MMRSTQVSSPNGVSRVTLVRTARSLVTASDLLTRSAQRGGRAIGHEEGRRGSRSGWPSQRLHERQRQSPAR